MELARLLEDTRTIWERTAGTLDITGISYNTKDTKQGDIFVCIKGYSKDGHAFAADAAQKGAAAIVAEEDAVIEAVSVPVIRANDTRAVLSHISARFFEDPSADMDIFGVTGTNGKTSITYMIRMIMEQEQKSCGVIGTIACEYAGKRENIGNTTPESYELQRILADMKQNGVGCCAMEVSSHALALRRASDIRFLYGVFTNLTPDHLDFHETLDAYFEAKKQLFYMVKKASVINVDDDYGRRLFTELKNGGYPVYSYSLKDKNAAYYADILTMDETGSSAQLFVEGVEKGVFTTKIPGIFSVYNVVAALAVSLLAGACWESAITGVSSLSGVPGRFETVTNDRGILAIVDYAHTPDALENVLKTANSFKKGRLICVFGCGGDRDRTKRPLMGKAAGTHADYCLITSDNPRTENPAEIIQDVEEGLYDTGCNYEVIENRYEAIRKAVSMYQKNDVILVAGKGHEDYQIIGEQKIHFDDRQALKEIIAAL